MSDEDKVKAVITECAKEGFAAAKNKSAEQFDAFWAKYYASDDITVIRPSGNPMGKEMWKGMFTSTDVVMESSELKSIDSTRIFAGGNAAVATYTMHDVFTYKVSSLSL